MLRLIEAAVAPGGEPLVEEVDWAILPGEKIGVVGRNGTGKTTLLRALLGEQLLDTGRREQRPGLVIGWLPQGAVAGVEGTVWEVARSGMVRFHALAERLSAAEQALARGEPGALERHAAAEDLFRQAGGYAVDQVTGGVLHGLGFGPETWHRPCDTFSGGWQMRVALARMLLSEPDLALLDEPTNHLDLAARSWLSGYLSRVPYAVVVVSHDRHLLERVPGRIVEVRGGRLHSFSGNYRTWRKERERRLEAERAAFARQQGEIARLERFVERFGAKATKAAQARSRQNALDRMDRLEAPEEDTQGPRLRFPAAPASDREVLKLKRAAFGWPEGPTVLAEVSLVLERGQRAVVLGPNGIGKSTLLHALAGRLPLRSGRRRVGDRVRVGVFTQDLAAELPGDETGLSWLEGVAPALPPQRLRATLGGLGLSGDDALRPIHQLSGGERARVALAGLVARSCNVLLLDEPTNHLDAETCDALADALEAFDGAVLLVSHDRSLVEQLATHTWRVLPGAGDQPGRVEVHEGLKPEFFEPPPLPGEAPTERSAAVDHAERKRRARELERLTRRVAELEVKITQAEAALAGLEEQLYDVAGDPKRFQDVSRQQQQGRRKLEDLTAQWEEAEVARESLARSLGP